MAKIDVEFECDDVDSDDVVKSLNEWFHNQSMGFKMTKCDVQKGIGTGDIFTD